jgi:hypothetical protein
MAAQSTAEASKKEVDFHVWSHGAFRSARYRTSRSLDVRMLVNDNRMGCGAPYVQKFRRLCMVHRNSTDHFSVHL